MRHVPDLPACLVTASGLRVPVFDRDVAPSVKISELESYLLLSAYWQGECAYRRLEELAQLVPLEDEWDHLTGWEHLPRTSRSEKGVTHAKRTIRPDLYDRMQDMLWLVRRLSEEVDRLERDSTKISRAYTMLTGS